MVQSVSALLISMLPKLITDIYQAEKRHEAHLPNGSSNPYSKRLPIFSYVDENNEIMHGTGLRSSSASTSKKNAVQSDSTLSPSSSSNPVHSVLRKKPLMTVQSGDPLPGQLVAEAEQEFEGECPRAVRLGKMQKQVQYLSYTAMYHRRKVCCLLFIILVTYASYF